MIMIKLKCPECGYFWTQEKRVIIICPSCGHIYCLKTMVNGIREELEQRDNMGKQ